MAKVSAGIVMLNPEGQALLVHPGGPYFARRDLGVWGIPKGMREPGEDLEATARREFEEELGLRPPDQLPAALGNIRQSGGKTVHAWAFVGQWDPAQLVSNYIEIQWPPRSGKLRRFAEVDRAEFFDRETAEKKIVAAQRPLLQRAWAWFDSR